MRNSMSVSLLKPKTYLSQRKAMQFEYHTAKENTGLVSLNNKTILEILYSQLLQLLVNSRHV